MCSAIDPDRNVPLERSGFEFQAESDNLFDISQIAIESRSAAIAKEAVGGEITARQRKKEGACSKLRQ